MAEHDLISPLLTEDRLSQPADEPQVIITVDDDRNSNQPNIQNDQTNNTHLGIENPFEFLGARPVEVPATSTIDPFRNHTQRIEGVYEWLKILICVPIAIVRLVLFGLSLLVGFVATKFALQGWKDKQNPMPKWRCRLMWVTRICGRCILFSFGYHWIKRKGKPAPRETAPIVVSNHVSYIEPIFFFYELFPTIVAAESHDSIPFVGTIIRAMQVIYVNRFSSSSRKHAVSEIKVEYLPVVSPLENQKENAVHFAKRTGHAIATALNVVQTGHAYGDFMLFAKAAESKQTFHLSSLEAMDFLDTFLSMNPDSSGHVKIHDFSRVLRLKSCSLSEKFVYGSAHVLKQPLFRQACELAFTECHADGNHYIAEQELGDSINQAIPNLNQYEIHELFKLFDTDNDGKISKDDFSTCLRRNPLLIALFSPKLIHKNLSESR
ncbi:hypothetical protein TEA_013933 [Camellia sinensis var. sinensis]|uniref:EF-hand domain-containing protein n=1 Tax=Camellia sinensis var. sinensis TaxID=542762 RepID=A0A4V3WP48_CAMSN|nr:hypothetical protein TEA_013933 [Camellia sinensis var. sinensis]